MLTGIDISGWQEGYQIAKTRPGFVMVKATEGIGFVSKTCDGFVQSCIDNGIPWGFYHYAKGNDASREATYFHEQTRNYEMHGIPALDFEETKLTNAWMEEFVRTYHDLSGVFPWVYMNSDFINNRGYGTDYVRKNCGLWLAGYPQRLTTYPAGMECPYPHKGWTLACWQFTDRLQSGGMSVDGDIFYGSTSAWEMYATAGRGYGSRGDVSGGGVSGGDEVRGDVSLLENDEYVVTVKHK